MPTFIFYLLKNYKIFSKNGKKGVDDFKLQLVNIMKGLKNFQTGDKLKPIYIKAFRQQTVLRFAIYMRENFFWKLVKTKLSIPVFMGVLTKVV